MQIQLPRSHAKLAFSMSYRPTGFSLVEVAVVLVIISILVTAIAIPLSTQIEVQRVQETRRQLELAKEAVYGFAIANGRLPCPATVVGTTATEAEAAGVCTNQIGFLPAVTLGLSGTSTGGYLTDAWDDGTALRRIRYAVSDANTSALTKTDGIKTQTMSTVSGATHLTVCDTGLVVPPSAVNCGTTTTLGDKAPFIIYSLGKDASSTANDSLNNQNAVANVDRVFTGGAQTVNFDDIVTWGNLNTLFARMVQAGKLP
jgi:prepilin-type N-terminal cleavage/methylation domain-containing protein